MTVKIDKTKCIGCGGCTNICPGNLLFMNNDNKAEITDKRDCWDCASCIKECGVSAISMYLQPEIGGRGSEMTANKKENSIEWKIKDKNGKEEIIEVENSRVL